jgi:hypothetical protein
MYTTCNNGYSKHMSVEKINNIHNMKAHQIMSIHFSVQL